MDSPCYTGVIDPWDGRRARGQAAEQPTQRARTGASMSRTPAARSASPIPEAAGASVMTAVSDDVGQNVENERRDHFVWSTRPTVSVAAATRSRLICAS